MNTDTPTTPASPESWLRLQARSVKADLLTAIALNLVSGLLIIAQARLLATICQRVVIEHSGLSPLLPLLGWIAGLVLLLLQYAIDNTLWLIISSLICCAIPFFFRD